MDQPDIQYDYTKKEDHRVALREFRKAIQDILEPHHDDMYLYKWLKARDFDIGKAEKMIRESFKFRKKMGSNTILTPAYELPEVFLKHQVTFSIGFDKENSPFRIFMIGLCDSKGFAYSLRLVDMLKLTIYFLEKDMALIRERNKTSPVFEEKSSFIVDFTNFSLKNFYDKTVINSGIQLLKMYQDNYPENLKAAHVINVPSYFTWLFNIFKPFLNEVTLSKIKVYKPGEHREHLRKILDPKILPAFMGGDLTDPDGNPKCHHLINWNPKIDPSYYLKESLNHGGLDDTTMKSATVQQRSTFQVPVDVAIAGSILKWVFRTKEYNIRFGLFYKADNKSSNMQELIPVEGVDCQLIPEENEYICEKIGTYVLHFDNTYSWLTAKQIWYKVEVEKMDVIQNNNN